MSRMVGTVSRGIRTPIIRPGEDLAQIVVDSVVEASKCDSFSLNDKDVVGITESVVARAQNNYASVDDIAQDIKAKFGDNTIGVIFPITSRNRFGICLRGIARGAKKIVLMLSYPSDEVGNQLVSEDLIEEKGVNPYSDVLDIKKYRALFGDNIHEFTGIDYVAYYQNLAAEENCEIEIIFANHAKTILNYTKHVLCCDIHTRQRTQRKLQANGAQAVYTMENIMSASINGSGYNEKYGLLGSNKATEESVKLFPRDCDEFAQNVQDKFKKATGKNIEVLVYGDGAFKDPIGKIWELADPVVSPGHTRGLIGQPNEIKLKYLADNKFANLSGDELKTAITNHIKSKGDNLVGSMESQGTTPRRLTDLIGSLCDLTSGSGDKGTPVILIQGYFDNYSD